MEDYELKTLNKKKEHPKEKAGYLSSIFFCWTIPTFLEGLKKDLDEDDLFKPLNSHESKKLGDALAQTWANELLRGKPSLTRVIVKVFYKDIVFYSFFLLVQELVTKTAQPLLVGNLMDYYVPKQTNVSLQQAYLYACGIIFLTWCNVMLSHNSYFGLLHLSLRMQVACRSLIYRKALNLSKSALAESTIGQMVNLISNDVSRFDYICLHLYQLVVAPIQTVIVLYLLFATVDATAMVGVGLLVVVIPFLFYLGKLSYRYRFRTSIKTDQRLRLMNEIISGMQVIKMYTWEKPFAKLVQVTREAEIHEIKANAYIRAFYISTTVFLTPLAIFLCILTYVLSGNTLQARFVYVVSSFYGVLCPPLAFHLPRCTATLAEIKVSLNRIQTFLLREEVQSENPSTQLTRKDAIVMENVDVKWNNASTDLCLTNISLTARQGQLTAIVGRVGSGKTTILNTILQEAVVASGNLIINGSISYASQEPWLFSASIRQNILFGQQMNKLKYQKIIQVCALEQDFVELPHGDRTIVGEKGIMLSGGQKARVGLARAIYKDADIYLLDDPLSAVDVKVGKQIFEQCIAGYLKSKCTILVTHQLQYLNNVHQLYLIENGGIVASGTYAELQNIEGDFFKLLQDKENDNLGNEVTSNMNEDIIEKKKENGTKEAPTEVKEEKVIGQVSKKVYLRYFFVGGRYFYPLLVFLTYVLTQIGSSGTDYFLTFWVNLEQKRLENRLKFNITQPEDNVENTFFTSDNLLYIYASITVFLTFIVLASVVCFITFTFNTAKYLHDTMFEKIVYATMRFFYTNPSGRVLNRFARDVNIVDEALPVCLMDCIQVFLNVIAIAIIVSSVNVWIILPTCIVFTIFYGYKYVFLATSRNLKRMEAIARSPMFSHLAASLQGLSTIRAFKAQRTLEQEFDNIQNHHSSVRYLFVACSRTFGFWLDINCIIYTAIVILSFLIMGNETYGGNVGLAVTQAIALTGMLQKGIRSWSELENQMTSVERIMEYTELPREPDEGKKIPNKIWPHDGNIEFKNVSMRYFEGGPYVLKNINFSIAANEKIGVVGRTGAGKSSLSSALFRLALVEGVIIIDGLNIKDIPLNNLRSVMSIIPQEPVMFSGHLRKNLDPFDEYSDDELWNALEEVELKKLISDFPSGLATNLSESGSNLSVGERQLLCLARAIVRKNKILILDEATANVDLQTDELIQRTIRRKFSDCSVITIAHRLHTIMDSNRILVLNEGCVVEFDSPHLLLQNTEGLFYSLVEQTGASTSENLRQIAQQSFLSLAKEIDVDSKLQQ